MLVLPTSTPVIVARKKALGNVKNGENSKNGKNGDKNENSGTNLIQVPYIQYLITFQKQLVTVLFNSKSKVNNIHPIFTKELGLSIRLTAVGA